MSTIEHIAHYTTEHPVLVPVLWAVDLTLHSIGMAHYGFIQINPQLLSFTQWLSFVLAICVSLCVLGGYVYKFYKWIKSWMQ